MKIIEIQALSNGAHRNQNGELIAVPPGWAVIPESIPIPNAFPFVNITVNEGVVTSMTAGVLPEPEATPEPEPTPQDDTDALLVDHEFRLTVLELGV